MALRSGGAIQTGAEWIKYILILIALAALAFVVIILLPVAIKS
jgi:hypothetical protein